MLKLIKYLFISILILVLLIVGVSYLLPVAKEDLSDVFKPYANSHFTSIGKVRIHYRIWQPNNVKGRVLLLHGFSGSTFTWRYTAQYLYENGFLVVAADIPPYGYSEKRKDIDFSIKAQAERLWELCKQVDSSGKWSLLGHSMGAQTTGMMAALKPQTTDKLLFSNGFFSNDMAPPSNNLLNKLTELAPVMQLAEAAGKNYFYNEDKFTELLSSAYGLTPDSSAVNAYLRPFKYKYMASCILASMSQINECKETFADVKAPTLVIWGTKDKWIPLEKAEQFAETNQIIKLYKIDGAGHCPMETHQKEFNAIVLNFLN